MSKFTIFPAIDLRNGRVVRLEQGDPDKETVFGTNAIKMAEKWIKAGAKWLHIVNLDGAFDEAGAANWAALPAICELDVKVQFGGGIRTLDDIERALKAGARRVILGTVAIEKPDLVSKAVEKFGKNKILVGIDAHNGRVKTRGWLKDTAVNPVQLGKEMKERGVKTIIYTDIGRDGLLGGVDVQATVQLSRVTGLNIIASGGVAGLEDIRRCHAQAEHGIVGVITGRAIYDGRIELEEALNLIKPA
ncbi:MAG: 1-(5-phosphoribosyl)-5-[(5-phosphoribosylamino)methylideneamino]imidazole-4-carboxamide isomerase [Anaerolineales bacterium]|nr:1-(5-phosphoribosyl)-5-[(5-phosphoribosylamino)methylideneamino]imidazole-4-carboxamide isomerase [Anaerolineales bacterium]MCA9942992.1 1-(5-phosphoribosyl)-5-[(5-phosphoribosylamino)methylideneamino]imidazole-4-carboxamide isomerase [Anaerolineales bacterium]MCB8937170.1 1-(5-phosphoribosyl)-5-[(5-phosphoribosylamino)methylideneamino]imidazole-4-carboxamide isomerase [Ardenticatenaceae bacterium]